MTEKDYLLPQAERGFVNIQYKPASASRCSRFKAALFAFCWFFIFAVIARPFVAFGVGEHISDADIDALIARKCPQVGPITPHKSSSKLEDSFEYLSSSKYRNFSIEALSGAVKIPTVSFDDMGPVEGEHKDKRWDVYNDFVDYLKEIFPNVYDVCKTEIVNQHGLLYTWEGSNTDLKPVLLMSHYDVVPVEEKSIDEWEYPPWSGHYDGESIWGRGSSDDKNNVIAQLEAIEGLIKAGFKPRRTIILSVGFDEEIGGPRGAAELGKHLEKRYGRDSVAAIIDEGPGSRDDWGTHFSAPGTAEKGYADVHVEIRMNGGHSSAPPAHTAIGVMSQLIALNEANPYNPHLADDNPYLGYLYCGAAHSPKFPKTLRRLLRQRLRDELNGKKPNTNLPDPLAEEAARQSNFIKFLMTTAVAADVITGGVKANALPEFVSATLNHRINIGSSLAAIKHVQSTHASTVAKIHNLTVYAFTKPPAHANNCIILSISNAFEPAPVTPTSIDGETPYKILSGTTKALSGTDVIVSPGLMTGGTDTKHYWQLTRHIFRFNPSRSAMEMGNIHTVNEYIDAGLHVYAVRWYWTWLRNMDESKLD